MAELLVMLNDPNIIYLFLIAGLWLGISAIYIPGTGIIETLAFVVLAIGFFALIQAEPMIWATILLVVGSVLVVLLPFAGARWGNFAEVGLALQIVGGYFLLGAGEISVWLILGSMTIALLYNRALLLPTLRVQRERKKEEERGLIGQEGRVVMPLDPVGTVYVGKQLWSARSIDPLPEETRVVVVAQHGLTLTVEKAKRGATDPLLMNQQDAI